MSSNYIRGVVFPGMLDSELSSGVCSITRDFPGEDDGASSAGLLHTNLQPASNTLLTRPASLPATVEELTHDLHALLSRTQPTIMGENQVQFYPACVVDGKLAFVRVILAWMAFVDGAYVKLDTPRIAGIVVYDDAFYTVLLHPAEGTQEDCRPGTVNFYFAQLVCAALAKRLERFDSAAERLMRELTVAMRRDEMIEVPISVIATEGFDASIARLRAIEDRSASLLPQQVMRHADFVRLSARLVQHHYPKKERVTGLESTWDELREHDGIEFSQFDLFYSANRRIDNIPHIDLCQTARSEPIDHGLSPVRNDFMLKLVLDETTDAVRFSISGGVDETVGLYNINAFLDMYELIVNAGYPVVIDPQVREFALGTGMVRVSRDDPRLPADGGYRLTPETVPIVVPLAKDAPDSLPPLIHL